MGQLRVTMTAELVATYTIRAWDKGKGTKYKMHMGGRGEDTLIWQSLISRKE